MGPALGTILRRVRKNKHTRIVCIADNVIPHEKRPGDKPFTSYFLKSQKQENTWVSPKIKRSFYFSALSENIKDSTCCLKP
jgi:hypothetical protein